MALTPITRHFGEALVKLAPWAWGRPRIAALLQAYINPLQEIETRAWEVLESRDVNTADTARLDVLGKIVGQPRHWSDDEVYRRVIRARTRAQRSRGLTNDIIAVVRVAGSITTPVVVASFSPATATVTLNEPITAEVLTALQFLLPKARAVGVQMHLYRPITEDSLTFGSSVSPGIGGALGSSVSGSGDEAYSVYRL